MIGGKPEEIAITTGTSTGVAAVAYGLEWKPGDEVITTKGEFPLQYTAWKPMEEREGVKLKIVAPRERFITADDLIAAMTPRTRIVSVSLVRFNDASLLDAARVAEACHAQGALLLLDASQCCGTVPMAVEKLGADFVVSAGYKGLLGPFGTGFFWARSEQIAKMRPGPFYWMAVAGSDNFASLNFDDPKPAAAAKRWDTAEPASYFNFNLVAMDASADFVLRVGAETVAEHCRGLIEFMYQRLPKDRCIPDESIGPIKARCIWMLRGAHAGKNGRALSEFARGKYHRQPSRRKHSRLPASLQHQARIDRLISVITT